jgi:choline dehydrogenase-like flavoprotein
LVADQSLEADVVIIGSGAGGGNSAEILAQSGLNVIIVEEGPLQTSRDFHMKENEAYSNLYQESAGRQTKDRGIKIFQGRMVGGGTGINWTTSFRTPAETLKYWAEEMGFLGFRRMKCFPGLNGRRNATIFRIGRLLPTQIIVRWKQVAKNSELVGGRSGEMLRDVLIWDIAEQVARSTQNSPLWLRLFRVH